MRNASKCSDNSRVKNDGDKSRTSSACIANWLFREKKKRGKN